MVWVADPNNLLSVSEEEQHSDFIGWWTISTALLSSADLLSSFLLRSSGRNSYLTPGAGLGLGSGVNPGFIFQPNTRRTGNLNQSITLPVNGSIISHLPTSTGIAPEENLVPSGNLIPYRGNRYANRLSVDAGSVYTFGVTSIGTRSAGRSTMGFHIVWIDAANKEISRASQGIISEFGQRVRNSVVGQAPTNAVGAVIQIDTDHSVMLTRPTLTTGRTDIRFAPAAYEGDQWVATTPNLFLVDPETGGSAWMSGWADESGAHITPVNGTLPIAANGQARLYFRESPALSSHMGIPIVPGQQYSFAITEVPSRLSTIVELRIYDPTGTIRVATILPATDGNRAVAVFTAPANSAYMGVKLIAGSSATAFTLPTLIKGNTEPEALPPIYQGTVSVSFQLASDTTRRISLDAELQSDVNGQISNVTELQSDVLISAAHFALVVSSDSASTFSKSFVLSSDGLHAVGQTAPAAGLTPGLTLTTSTDLLTDAVTTSSSISYDSYSDSLESLSTSTILRSDSLKDLSKTFVLTSDSTESVHTESILSSDTIGPIGDLLKAEIDSDSLQNFSTSFVLKSDSRKTVSLIKVLASNTNQSLHNEFQLRSATTTRVSVRCQLKSSVNAPKRTRLVSAATVGV